MENLFFTLFFLSILALIVGLIKPSLVFRKAPEAKRTRLRVLKIFGTAAIVSVILGAVTAPSVDETAQGNEQVEQTNEETDAVKAEAEAKAKAEEEAKKNTETVSQKQAVRKAESYLEFTAFSKTGLVEQLEFEGFSNQDATYAVENIDVDWNEQAVKKAESYLEFSAFSRSGLIDQLEFEGFTTEQATHAVNQVGL